MIAILSPAKTLDYDSDRAMPAATRPRLGEYTDKLIAHAKTLTADDLARIMKISDALAQLNYDRYQNFENLPEKPAVQVFDGDVYTGLDAKSMSEDDILFAQDHLRILSGLYGILRPLDAMKPYRLEMGTKRFPGDHKLSIWWEGHVAKVLAEDVLANEQPAVLNLASQEYFASVKGRLPASLRVVDVEFLAADGRMITMHAKVARGTMARWMIDNRVTDIDEMRRFDYDGYSFDAEASTQNSWIFRRSS